MMTYLRMGIDAGPAMDQPAIPSKQLRRLSEVLPSSYMYTVSYLMQPLSGGYKTPILLH